MALISTLKQATMALLLTAQHVKAMSQSFDLIKVAGATRTTANRRHNHLNSQRFDWADKYITNSLNDEKPEVILRLEPQTDTERKRMKLRNTKILP